VIVVVVLLALVAWFGFIAKSGTLVVTVQSDHLLVTVTYRVFLDGALRDEGTLEPGQYVEYTFPLAWMSDSCQSHQASADSTGGGLGPESDSEVVSVCSGTTEHVTLTI